MALPETLQDFTIAPGRSGRLDAVFALERACLDAVSRLPVSLRVVLEAIVQPRWPHVYCGYRSGHGTGVFNDITAPGHDLMEMVHTWHRRGTLPSMREGALSARAGDPAPPDDRRAVTPSTL